MNILGISITRTGKAPAPDYSAMTLQEQFQERYGKNAVNDLFKVFDFVKRATMVVTWVAMGISYFHQKHYFESRGAGAFAWVIPVSIDCVMLVFMKISQLPAIKPANRWIARGILVLPAGGSMLVNFMATEDLVLRWVYVGVVGAIVICEIGHGLMVPHLASMEKKQAEISAPAVVAAPVAPKVTRKTQIKKADKARDMAANSPNLTATELAAASGVAYSTAKKIIDEIRAVAPTSPGPAGNGPAGPSAKELDEIVNTPAYL